VLYDQKSAQTIENIDIFSLLTYMGLRENLSQQRANGVGAVVQSIQQYVQSTHMHMYAE
jgi:sulfur transfer protein SufE